MHLFFHCFDKDLMKAYFEPGVERGAEYTIQNRHSPHPHGTQR